MCFNIAAARSAEGAAAQRLGNKAFCVYYNIEMLKFCLCFRLSRKILEYILAFFEGKRNNIFAQKC